MRTKPREEYQSVNIVLRSGIPTGDDKGKQPKESEWVWKAPENKVGFDLERMKETFMEVKKSFTKASNLGSQDKLFEEMDPSMLTTFLETCIKLLCDRKAMKSLQELINKYSDRDTMSDGHCTVRKIGRHKTITRREMRLAVEIGEYEMDQVILDMGSDVNVFPK